MLDLARIRLLAYDQDGTLYPYSPDFDHGVLGIIASVIHKLTDGRVTVADAYQLSDRSYKETGSPWTLPVKDLGLDNRRLHAEFHTAVPCDYVEPLSELRQAFVDVCSTGATLAVVTHSHRHYTTRVLRKCAVDDLIAPEHIVTLEDVDYHEKSLHETMFVEVNRRTGIPAHETLVAEDSLKNLLKARAIGQHTAYIHWGTPLERLPAHVDMQTATPAELALAVAAARRKTLATAPACVVS